jgi:hypothetical protein
MLVCLKVPATVKLPSTSAIAWRKKLRLHLKLLIQFERFVILLNREPQMKRYLSLLALLLCASLCAGQNVTFYRFDKTFISNNYSDSAIGNLTVNQFHPAGNVHSTSCGGNNGELHIGFRLPEVGLPGNQMPLTAPPSGTDANWGAVAELPNASAGNGPSLLTQLAGTPITFHGYFRVWDEGHGQGASPPSNPHHVLEVHPAWGFDGGSIHFMRQDLVKKMPGFWSYGLAKYRPMFQSFSNGEWL